MGAFIGLIISFIAAILVGQDAKKRGMNEWGWGLFVFFILIIGLIVYFIVRKPILENKN
ncbi:MAG: PLDc N-terminal domain-containing protein [Bacteroidales bacterium]